MNQSEANRPVPSLPGVSQYGYDTLIGYVRPLYEIGLRSLLLFPVMDLKGLDKAIQPEHNPVLNVIPKMKKSFPQLTLLADVCLCAFTGKFSSSFEFAYML